MVNDVYTPTSLANAAGVTRSAVTKACREGRIPGSYRVLTRWIIPKAAGDSYIAYIKNSDESCQTGSS